MPNLYGLPTESQSNLNQRAHPGGGVETVSIQSGEGLVEDLYEAHLKGLYVAYREATAGRIAALAGNLEQAGFGELAEKVDEVLAGFYEAGLVKKAGFAGTLAAGMALWINPGVTLAYATYSFFYDELEDLEKDCQQLVMNIGGAQLFGDIGVGPTVGGWYDDDSLKNEGEINVQAQAMLDDAKKLQASFTKIRSLLSKMAGKPYDEEMTKNLVAAAQDADTLVSNLDENLAFLKKHYAPAAALDFTRTTSLLQDIKAHKDVLASSIKEAALKNGLQQNQTQSPSQTGQPQAKVVNPAPQSPSQLGETAQIQLTRAQEVMEDFGGIQSVINDKAHILGAGQKAQALMTPEFLGSVKNLRDNIIPSLTKGTRKPDKYPAHDATPAIERAEKQIEIVYKGLAAIQ